MALKKLMKDLSSSNFERCELQNSAAAIKRSERKEKVRGMDKHFDNNISCRFLGVRERDSDVEELTDTQTNTSSSRKIFSKVHDTNQSQFASFFHSFIDWHHTQHESSQVQRWIIKRKRKNEL